MARNPIDLIHTNYVCTVLKGSLKGGRSEDAPTGWISKKTGKEGKKKGSCLSSSSRAALKGVWVTHLVIILPILKLDNTRCEAGGSQLGEK